MSTEKYHTLLPLFEELQGERVVLRPYRESDAQALFEAINESRAHIRPWLPFADAHQTVEESRDWIIRQQAQILLREDMNFSLWDRVSGHYVGGNGLHPRNWKIGYFEIGYWLRTSATGHGYMTEAVKLLTEYLFTHFKANRVEIRCDAQNERSAAVAQRLGFVQEGQLRNNDLTPSGNLRDTLIFALTPEDRRVH
ncbi:MAG: GNAT family N-acetyltransferase [Ktedonobacteraceae bacterium]